MNALSILSVLIITTYIVACSDSEKSSDQSYPPFDGSYPPTEKGGVVDDYFGTEVPDPYRWLEVDTAVRVEQWVDAENEVTFGYLKDIPFRDDIMTRYEQLY